MRQLLLELHAPSRRASLVYCDNISAVYMTSNPVQHQRTKHIEIDLHFVWECVTGGDICVMHVPTSSQYAYIFTKGFLSSEVTWLRQLLLELHPLLAVLLWYTATTSTKCTCPLTPSSISAPSTSRSIFTSCGSALLLVMSVSCTSRRLHSTPTSSPRGCLLHSSRSSGPV